MISSLSPPSLITDGWHRLRFGQHPPATSKAASFCVAACLPSSDQPPVSRILTKLIGCRAPPSSACDVARKQRSPPGCRPPTGHHPTSPPPRSEAGDAAFWQSMVALHGSRVRRRPVRAAIFLPSRLHRSAPCSCTNRGRAACRRMAHRGLPRNYLTAECYAFLPQRRAQVRTAPTCAGCNFGASSDCGADASVGVTTSVPVAAAFAPASSCSIAAATCASCALVDASGPGGGLSPHVLDVPCRVHVSSSPRSRMSCARCFSFGERWRPGMGSELRIVIDIGTSRPSMMLKCGSLNSFFNAVRLQGLIDLGMRKNRV